jgi:hypothetical protein
VSAWRQDFDDTIKDLSASVDDRISAVNHEIVKRIPELVQVEMELFEDKAKTTFNDLLLKQSEVLMK